MTDKAKLLDEFYTNIENYSKDKAKDKRILNIELFDLHE